MNGFIGMSVIFLVLGLVIRFGKKVEILPGYHKKEFAHKEDLAKWSGNVLFGLSVLSLGGILIGHVIENQIVGVVMGVVYSMLLIYGGVMVLMVGTKKFKNKT